jgi:hypothetical protein
MENKPQPILPPEQKQRHFHIFWPLLLIAVGIFLFLNSSHMLPGNTLDTLLDLWPLLFVIAGVDGILNRAGFVWSVLLAGLGVIFLLANFGYIQVSAWTVILRLWPVLLIAWGLDLLIGRRRTWISWVVGIVVGLILVGGIYWFASTYSDGQAPRLEVVNHAISGAKSGDGKITMAAGILEMAGGASSTNIVEARISLRNNQNFNHSSQVQNDVNEFYFQDDGSYAIYPFEASNYSWVFKLNESIPLMLDLEMAAGEMDLDFSSLQISSFKVKIAAGTISLSLPGTGSYSGVVEGAASTMKIYIPKSSKLCLQSETAVTFLSLPSGFDKSADCGKPSVPTLEIKNAVGVVTVEYSK